MEYNTREIREIVDDVPTIREIIGRQKTSSLVQILCGLCWEGDRVKVVADVRPYGPSRFLLAGTPAIEYAAECLNIRVPR